MNVWKYGLGALLCFVGILSLSLGLTPLFIQIRSKPIVTRIPGENLIQLKLPGTYVGVTSSKGMNRDQIDKVFELEYSLLDKEKKESRRVIKFQRRQYASDREDQFPLIQFAVDKAGGYYLSGDYRIGIEGGQIALALFYVDSAYIRTELIVGFVLFLLLGIVGFMIIWKTYQAENPARQQFFFKKKPASAAKPKPSSNR